MPKAPAAHRNLHSSMSKALNSAPYPPDSISKAPAAHSNLHSSMP